MNCTCTHTINGTHAANCPLAMTGHTHTFTPSVWTYGDTTATPNFIRSINDEPEFEDVKVEKRWEQLRHFGIELPSNNLTRDLEESKRVLLQRGVHLREVSAAPDMGENVYQFIAATEGVKRDGNTLSNAGWNFNNFEKNPVFLFQHDYSQLPIGQHLKWEVTRDNGQNVLRIWSRFATADIYPFAERVRLMYEKGFLRAVSIGWIPLEYSPVRNEEGIQTGWLFEKNELLEVSAVSVPADPDAIIQGVNQRILDPSDIEAMATYVDSVRSYRNICHIVSNIDSARSAVAEEAPKEPEAIQEATPACVHGAGCTVCVHVEVEVCDDDEMDDTQPTDQAPMQMDSLENANPEPAPDEVRSEETPAEEPVDQAELLVHAQKLVRSQIYADRRNCTQQPYDPSRVDFYNEYIVPAYEEVGAKAPTLNEVEHAYGCSLELYKRGVLGRDKFERASNEQLMEGLLYMGVSLPDELSQILNEIRDVVDNINEVTRGIEYQVRVGSKISKSSRDVLKKCSNCLDQAKTHINALMGDDCMDDGEPNDQASSAPELDNELDVVAERTAALLRKLSGKPEPEPQVEVSVDDITERVMQLKRNVIDESADAVSATTKSKYIRDLLQKIMESEN